MKKKIHVLIYVNFLIGILYAGFMVFTTPRADYFLRRLYAFEAWLIIGFLCIYYAMTDFRKK